MTNPALTLPAEIARPEPPGAQGPLAPQVVPEQPPRQVVQAQPERQAQRERQARPEQPARQVVQAQPAPEAARETRSLLTHIAL